MLEPIGGDTRCPAGNTWETAGRAPPLSLPGWEYLGDSWKGPTSVCRNALNPSCYTREREKQTAVHLLFQSLRRKTENKCLTEQNNRAFKHSKE